VGCLFFQRLTADRQSNQAYAKADPTVTDNRGTPTYLTNTTLTTITATRLDLAVGTSTFSFMFLPRVLLPDGVKASRDGASVVAAAAVHGVIPL
jgi:hypothetical protein